MSINLSLETQDVNTVIEGLIRVQDNAARIQSIVRTQAVDQLNAQQAAAQAEQEAAKPTQDGNPSA